MRRTIVAIGIGFFLTLDASATFAAPATADTSATSRPATSGPEWCGFHNKAGDRVRCGFSSETDCKRAIGEPDAICIVDPYRTEIRRPPTAAG